MSNDVVVADGDDAARQDEGRDLRELEPGCKDLVGFHGPVARVVELGRVHADEGVVRVHRRLGAAGVLDDVLDGVRVEAELLGELLEDAVVRFEDVDPDQGVLLLEVLRDLVEGEVLVGDLALAPQHGVDAGGSHEDSVLPVTAWNLPRGLDALGSLRLAR